jgi:predicted Holliday junction resolvase-like endonuclease
MEIIISVLIVVILILTAIIYIQYETIKDLVFNIESWHEVKKLNRKLERVRESNKKNLNIISNLKRWILKTK